MAILFTTDKGTISKGIASIAKRGKNLDTDIGVIAASSVAHAQIHGDVTLFASLLSALPKGSRSATLLAWVQSAAPISASYNAQKSSWSAKIDKKRETEEFDGDRSTWDIETLKTTEWFAFEKAASSTEFTEEKLLKILTQIAEGKKKNATEGAMDLATLLLLAAKVPAPVSEPA